MTPDAPTWAEIERFLKIDGWTRLPAASRGGASQDHIFYEKLLAGGELLQTHISHSGSKRPSSGRFAAIVRDQLRVSREDFWTALRNRVPVNRPSAEKATPAEHDAWVLAVLTHDLHMTREQVASLGVDQAREIVLAHWSRPLQS
ncbi:MAG: hypothetical protein ACRDK4_03185 [Solirubrobacteraceae bacterium]